MFRNRRLGVRRVLELAEFVPEKRGDKESIKANVLYRWMPAQDVIGKHSDSVRFYDELSLHTGLTIDEINKEIASKKTILDWMVKRNHRDIEHVGRIMATYYMDKEEIVKLVEKDVDFKL